MTSSLSWGFVFCGVLLYQNYVMCGLIGSFWPLLGYLFGARFQTAFFHVLVTSGVLGGRHFRGLSVFFLGLSCQLSLGTDFSVGWEGKASSIEPPVIQTWY